MIGRLRKVENRAKAAGIDGNLRILRCEARNLLGRLLPDGSLDAIHILCPDPWPKNRHRGHRLLCSDFMAQIHRVLKADGILHFSSDDREYCRLMAENVEGSALFRPDQEAGTPWQGIVTDFERKWLEAGRTVEHRFWRRNPLPPKTIGH
jgi:tRNA (guanine-N7-)-methyltransferase